MKKFGDPFKEYEPLKIDHVSIRDTRAYYNEIADLGVNVDRFALTEQIPTDMNSLREPGEQLKGATKGGLKDFIRRVLKRPDFSDGIESELNKVKVSAAPVANVYQILPDQPELSDVIKKTLPYFNYYLVEFGLNVAVGREAKIPKLKYIVDLYPDSDNRTDVTTYNVAPSDSIKRVKIIEGKVKIGINSLLEFIPGSIGEIIPNLLDIEINPIEFRWEHTKYEIDVSGPLDYNVFWFIYKTDVVQSFNPMVILKSRKEINEITAKIEVLYQLQTGRLRDLESKSELPKRVKIIPL